MPEDAENDEARFPWRTRVLDAQDRYAYVKVGAVDGVVVVEAPSKYWMDPDAADMLDLNFRAAANRARRQRQESQR